MKRKLREHKQFAPSIKLYPFIKTKKKKEIIKILKNSYSKTLSKKIILVSIIKFLLKKNKS